MAIWKHLEDTLCIQDGEVFRPTTPPEAALIGEIERLREALTWIRDELPGRDGSDFETMGSLVQRLRARAIYALTS